MAGGGLRGIMAILPWTPCRVRHRQPNGSMAITAPPAPARHPRRGEYFRCCVRGRGPSGLSDSTIVRHRSASHIGSAAGASRSHLPRAAHSAARSLRWFDRAPGQPERTPQRSLRPAEGARVSNRSEDGRALGVGGDRGREVRRGSYRQYWVHQGISGRSDMSCELRPFRCSCSGISPTTASPESRCKLTAHRIKRTASASRASGERSEVQLSGERLPNWVHGGFA